jgi:hypothetical protein
LLWPIHTRARWEISWYYSLFAVASRSNLALIEPKHAPGKSRPRCPLGVLDQWDMRPWAGSFLLSISKTGFSYISAYRRFGRSDHLPVNGMRSHAAPSDPPKCGTFPQEVHMDLVYKGRLTHCVRNALGGWLKCAQIPTYGGYCWIGHKPGSGFSDRPRGVLGVFASLDRF